LKDLNLKKMAEIKYILYVVLLLFCFCDQNRLTAESLVEKSILAHGGENMIKSIQYTKSTKLFTENGELENHLIQKITHQWDPFFTLMEWEHSDGIHSAVKKSGEISLTVNGALITDSLQLTQTGSSLDAAFYVFWQPFKLIEPSAKKVFLGRQKILDSIEVLALKVSYSDDPKADLWHYYFDPNTYKIKAVKVKHKKRSSLIINERYETATGLSLNKTRKSYFLDSLGQITYLRAAYQYEILSVNYKK